MSAEVVRLAAVRDREILLALQQLTALAQKGELRGFQFSVEDVHGKEKLCALGSYSRRPAHGAQAAMRLAMRMGHLEDQRQEEEGGEPTIGWRR